MNTEEIASLLRQARPAPPPFAWKVPILSAASAGRNSPATPLIPLRLFLPRLAWGALAACWAVILLLHAITPEFPQGTVPFDPIAYQMRMTVLERLVLLDQPIPSEEESHSTPARQTPSPIQQEPIRMEIHLQLLPRNSGHPLSIPNS